MSCEIKLLSNIVELKLVQDFFGLSSDENWLNAIKFSLSPTSDILTFAHGSLFVILTSKWDRERQLHIYKITYKGVISGSNSIATSVINIPIIGQSVSSHVSVDWTCIAIGLENGYVMFYSDNGTQIYSQLWHNEPVYSLKAQSGKNLNEELYISYMTCVCIVQGMHLFPVLKNMKQQASKFSISKSDNQSQEQILCRKWAFGGKGMTITDNVVVGPQKICSFDHLLTASLEGGFYAKYRSAAPQNSLVVAVGTKPYIGFHYAKEGFAQPVLADVARAVASKIKSALPSWFGGSSQSQQTEPQLQLMPSEPMVCRFGLCDLQRNAFSVWLAPGNKLAAVADNLGRIVLVDCSRGIALRLWKGYRDAQCGFIEVNEKMQKKTPSTADKRKAMFLIIFAPRRAVIEIWSLQNGPKVAAFNASRNGQLIYNTYSYMGVTQNSSKIKYVNNSCLFFDATDSYFKEITVPFHCALSDSNSKTAKDMHLLKRLKICLKSGDGSEDEDLEEMAETCQSFETDDIKMQCIEMLVKNKKIYPKLFKMAIEAFLKEDEEKNNLQIVCENYLKLTKLYIFLNSVNEDENMDEDEVETIKLSDNELGTIQKLIDLSTINNKGHCPSTSKVKFEEKTSKINNFVEYLAAFNVINEDLVLLKDDSFELYSSIGKIIYDKLILNGNIGLFVDNVKEIGLLREDVMKLYLAYWLEQGFNYLTSEALIDDMTKFNVILRKICILAGDKIKFENNTICLWWQNVREYLLESSSALRGLLAAIMCRNEALKYEESSDDEEYNFEEVSQEACQWMLLIGKLDDVAVLGTILSDTLTSTEADFVTLKYTVPEVSLKDIFKGGKGVVSELVAKWVGSSGITPEKLIPVHDGVLVEEVKEEEGESSNLEKVYKNHVLTANEIVAETKALPEADLDPVLYNLNLLRQHFPFSLEPGTLLCQLTWEYMCDWSKNLSNIAILKAGMTCLKTIPRLQYALKHGLCCMIWNAHLKIPLEATKKLVNKVGRLPKEKLCLQDVGISDSLIPQFLELCIEFLEHFAGSIDHDKVELKFEELLQDGPIPLTSLALQQNSANMVLLKLHSELTTVLLILTSFNVKHQKPIQHLFDGMSNQSFFAEINRQLPYPLPKSDLILRKTRTEFLCKIITATMDLIVEDLENVFYQDHIKWMERMEKLVDVWDLDFTLLRKHQIVELYAHGWDTYAEELLESVIDEQSLGNLLLTIAGRRLTAYTKANPNVWGQVAAVGPLLSDYLDTLIASDNLGPQIHQSSSDVTIEKLTKLTGQAFKCLSGKDSKSKDLRIAGLMFDACATIKEMR